MNYSHLPKLYLTLNQEYFKYRIRRYLYAYHTILHYVKHYKRSLIILPWSISVESFHAGVMIMLYSYNIHAGIMIKLQPAAVLTMAVD